MADETYVTQFDAEPEFWQYLGGLRREDIITELIQNELDADSTHTRIVFDVTGFSCEGNGSAIDEDGWTRLSFIRGAGHQAPRKRNRIGVKNHGLKTYFTLGDEILLLSAGMLFKQTLYCDGPDSLPRPGTFERPIRDLDAPTVGCRVRVPYRTRLLATSVGEPLEFAVPAAEMIETLFEDACKDIPGRFIGAICPGVRERYRIEISHHLRGKVTYHFRCSPAKDLRGGGRLFTRTCTVSGDTSNFPPSLREKAFDFVVQLPIGSAHEIPQFYQAHRGFEQRLPGVLLQRERQYPRRVTSATQ